MYSASAIHSRLTGRNVRPYVMQKIGDAAVRELGLLGIRIPADVVHKQVRSLYAGDASLASLGSTSASIPTPVQFLQQWLPGFVKIMTAARKIDEILGITTLGNWEDEEIVQGVMEPTAQAQEYSDFQNVPLASWNVNFERRTIVRGEMGIQVGQLEEARAAAMRVSSSNEKRGGAAIALEQFRNSVGFFGYFNGNNRTYGFLNDPNLPDYVAVATGTWATKDWAAIVSDLREAIQALRTQSMDAISASDVDTTLVVPTARVDYLSTTNDFGISVWDWLKQTYPKVRVVSAPEMQIAPVDGQSTAQYAFYLFAENVSSEIDGSTDGGDVMTQLVQTKFLTLGVEKRTKSYVEDYANATAGVLVKRPYAVVRRFGI